MAQSDTPQADGDLDDGSAAKAGDQDPARLKARLTWLRLADFRNYKAARLVLEKPFIVLHGTNGSGKTNLLEAVSLLSPGRGLRRATYADMALKEGSGGFSVEAALTSRGDEARILTKVTPEAGGTRQVRIDDTMARSAEELLSLMRVLWLTPAMDGLFTGPAADRRRFLDRMVLALDPAHGRRAADYERAMRSRNRLLADGRLDDAWLSGLEDQMAGLGIAMAIARAELVALLREPAPEEPGEHRPFPRAVLELDHGFDLGALDRPAAMLEDEMRDRLAAARAADRHAGRTLEGPHRADLRVVHAAKAMPAALSSTGEQKALLIGLVLAHARLTATISGLPPIVLLDEVAAHLDARRRAALFDIIGALGVQAFMTGTDASLFEALGARAQFLEVEAGTIRGPGVP